MNNSTASQTTWLGLSEEDTERLGRLLADLVPDSTVIGLMGTLGAGKTRLVQAIAVACGVDRQQVVSPTFVLCHEYYGNRTIFHFDAYRVKDAAEFESLGTDDYFFSPAISIVEWSDRVESVLPCERLDILIEILTDGGRRFTITAYGQRLADVPTRVAQAFNG